VLVSVEAALELVDVRKGLPHAGVRGDHAADELLDVVARRSGRARMQRASSLAGGAQTAMDPWGSGT
jgi:hypothetical protein